MKMKNEVKEYLEERFKPAFRKNVLPSDGYLFLCSDVDDSVAELVISGLERVYTQLLNLIRIHKPIRPGNHLDKILYGYENNEMVDQFLREEFNQCGRRSSEKETYMFFTNKKGVDSSGRRIYLRGDTISTVVYLDGLSRSRIAPEVSKHFVRELGLDEFMHSERPIGRDISRLSGTDFVSLRCLNNDGDHENDRLCDVCLSVLDMKIYKPDIYGS